MNLIESVINYKFKWNAKNASSGCTFFRLGQPPPAAEVWAGRRHHSPVLQLSA